MNLIVPQSSSASVRNSREFAGKVVVVTGASAGVGRATARRFAQAGASVAIVARDDQALEETRAELVRSGAEVTVATADVADAKAVLDAAGQIEEELGPIDIWVNCAMATVFSPVAEMTPEEFHRVTEVTYLGFVYGTMAALRSMRRRNRGTIVQVGSALAYRGIPLQAAYCGAKHAIRGFTESLRTELMNEGSRIRVTMVQLPAVNTPQFDWARTHVAQSPRPVAPVYQPEAVAAAILEAAKGTEPEYWLGRSTIVTILGNMIFPGLVDRYLARKGVKAQQTGSYVPDSRRDNLFEAVHGLHRTRGSFGRKAQSSVSVWGGNQARLLTAGAVLGLAVLAGGALMLGARAGTRRRWR
ncbi:MAG: SDR family oxidoreductase [Rhizobiales bacterium]|jgi:NAD(P)-dependent dehydrogenase (short-subunit alcohol dehydrogenase family)|nr:SDR family oxidoreductase [Hyphomicrobiales bacterium]